jgi:HlyD family secretion protein
MQNGDGRAGRRRRPGAWIAGIALLAAGAAALLRGDPGALPAWAAWLSGPTAAAAPPPVSAPPPDAPGAIAALGRLQPKDGVIRVAGPSLMVAVVDRLLVEEGDHVKRGEVIALLDDVAIREAAVARAKARVAFNEAELARTEVLHQGDVISDSKRDALRLELDLARADLRRAQAELERTHVRSPFDGQVLEVHARDGERVDGEGIVELGRTQQMYAVAEVYETDIGRVRLGQHAVVRSPALARPLHGSVDRIGLEIGKLDALGTDPAARTDARVVEVEIRLDEGEGELAAALTHLQVEIEIEP